MKCTLLYIGKPLAYIGQFLFLNILWDFKIFYISLLQLIIGNKITLLKLLSLFKNVVGKQHFTILLTHSYFFYL